MEAASSNNNDKREGFGFYVLPGKIRLAMAASAPIFGPTGNYMHYPDAVSIQATVDLVPGVGGNINFGTGKLFLLNGDGQKIANYTDFSLSVGIDIGASFEVTEYYYLGSGNLNLEMLDGLRWEVNGGFSIYGIEVGAGAVYAPVKTGGTIIGISYHVGISTPGFSGHVNYFGGTSVNYE